MQDPVIFPDFSAFQIEIPYQTPEARPPGKVEGWQDLCSPIWPDRAAT